MKEAENRREVSTGQGDIHNSPHNGYNTRMRRTLTKGITCLGIALIPTLSQAETNAGSGSLLDYAGVLLGVSCLNLGHSGDAGGSTQPAFGLEAGTQVGSHLGLGGFIGFGPASSTNSLGTSTTYTFATVGNYFLDPLLEGARIGLKAGFSYSSTSTQLLSGPLIAYDYSLGNGLSLGGETSFLLMSSDPWGDSLNFLFSIHYWF